MKVFSIFENWKLLSPSVPISVAGNPASLADEKVGESENSTGSLVVYVFLLFTLVCVSINSRIIFVVLLSTKRTLRSVTKLVVQYSAILISFSILILFEFIGESKIRMISKGSTEMCRALSYIRHVIYGIFPLNAAAFVHERFTGPGTPFGKLVEYKLSIGIWGISSLVNIPQILHVDYKIIPNTSIGHCTQVPILESQTTSVVYELIHFLVFHGLPCLYMALCVYRVRLRLSTIFKFEKLRRIRMLRRALRLLFVFLTTITFALLWLPTGLVTFIYSIQSYLVRGTTELNTNLLAFTTVLQYILLCIAPTMYMVMNPDLPPIFPGWILYQGNILAERKRRDWRRIASRAQRNTEENTDDIEMAILGIERGELKMFEDVQEIIRPIELEQVAFVGNKMSRLRPWVSPILSIDEMKDYKLMKSVKENPETTLLLN